MAFNPNYVSLAIFIVVGRNVIPYTKRGENTKCPTQYFIDFAIKLFYKFLIIICYSHKILSDSDEGSKKCDIFLGSKICDSL